MPAPFEGSQSTTTEAELASDLQEIKATIAEKDSETFAETPQELFEELLAETQRKLANEAKSIED